ncbi:alcohol dehydrogenase catalytic domain-containing protein [Pseudonocardia nantongensis]|uniref:alcohol dehydrogenase catalytic domain-containing protein n=1 Tax=Pseudonocardia nantongensis TaxID=1181885 RepID=UPI003978E2B7
MTGTRTVRAVRFHETGGPEVLRVEDVAVREPGPGEVRIRVHAAGLNRSEVNFRRGTYLEAPRLPAGLGSECAGTVLALGPDVTGWSAGDEVCVIPASSQNAHPVQAEEAVVPARALLPRPAGLDDTGAAAVWMPLLTVWGMTRHVARLREGDRLVVTAAANSIGAAALQVARYLGVHAVATVPDDRHAAALRASGAAEVVAGDGDPGDGDLRTALGGDGADLVLDAEGGPGVERLVRACAPGGAVIVHGGLSGEPTPLPAAGYAPVWLRRFHVREVTGEPAVLTRAAAFVHAGLAAGALAPLVDRVFDLDRVAAAHAYLEAPDRAPGKPVLRIR